MASKNTTITTQTDQSVQAGGDYLQGGSVSALGSVTQLREGSVLADEILSNTNISGANSGNVNTALTGSGNILEQLGTNTKDVLLGAIRTLGEGTQGLLDSVTKTTGLNLQPYTTKTLTTGETEESKSIISAVVDRDKQVFKTGLIAAAALGTVALVIVMKKGSK